MATDKNMRVTETKIVMMLTTCNNKQTNKHQRCMWSHKHKEMDRNTRTDGVQTGCDRIYWGTCVSQGGGHATKQWKEIKKPWWWQRLTSQHTSKLLSSKESKTHTQSVRTMMVCCTISAEHLSEDHLNSFLFSNETSQKWKSSEAFVRTLILSSYQADTMI